MMDIQNGEHRDRKNVKLFDMDVNGNYVFVSVIIRIYGRNVRIATISL